MGRLLNGKSGSRPAIGRATRKAATRSTATLESPSPVSHLALRPLFGDWLVGFRETASAPALSRTASSDRPSFRPMTNASFQFHYLRLANRRPRNAGMAEGEGFEPSVTTALRLEFRFPRIDRVSTSFKATRQVDPSGYRGERFRM